ncbi:MAG: thioredoxin family protein [Bacteroidales bacterium]|nr:thioredoxin family protein [Bacteroidales bacterium]
MELKVLGTGCANCKRLEEIVKQAINELNLNATIEKVQDIDKIISYGVMRTPALIANGKVLVSGRVPSLQEIKELLTSIPGFDE